MVLLCFWRGIRLHSVVGVDGGVMSGTVCERAYCFSFLSTGMQSTVMLLLTGCHCRRIRKLSISWYEYICILVPLCNCFNLFIVILLFSNKQLSQA